MGKYILPHVERNENPLGQDAIAISVTDDGESISTGEFPFLIQGFSRVDKSPSRHMGGTGLGLVIESVVGHGSAFTIYLSLAV